MKSILILLHCESNTGYAISPLERTFYEMAMRLTNDDPTRIHFAYPSMQRGPTATLPAEFSQFTLIDARSSDAAHHKAAAEYIERHGIDTVFGFDQPVRRPIYRHFRRAGVRRFIAYWGAPISSLFGPLKLTAKRIEVALSRHGPDHYIFESRGMADTGVLGRGIPRRKTSVVYQGVDTERFHPPEEGADYYAYEQLGIARDRKLFYYAGHMEPRKGVAVIMEAANRLAARRDARDWHIALFGNQPGEERAYLDRLSDAAREHVTFGGYRPDLPLIQRSCYAGMIASTGWDSFPRSGMEIQASGLPLFVSDLPGLNEMVVPGETGYVFRPGDADALAGLMGAILDDPARSRQLSANARRRVVDEFSLPGQIEGLVGVMRDVLR